MDYYKIISQQISMRSLYTDDIKGTRSRVTIFDKSIFKQKYNNFVRSNQKNPQHKKYQWYAPLKNQQNQSVNSYRQPRYTLKLMSEHTGLSKSFHMEQLKKVHENKNDNNLNKSSILTQSGNNLVNNNQSSLNKRNIDNGPYFPHKYQDYSKSKNKFTGNRNWQYQNTQKLQLPTITKSKLITYI